MIRRRASTPDTIERMSQIRDRQLKRQVDAIDVSALEADITTLQTDLGTAEGEIDTLQSDMTTHTHTASQVTDFGESVDDRVNALLQAGTGIGLAYNDGADTLTASVGSNWHHTLFDGVNGTGVSGSAAETTIISQALDSGHLDRLGKMIRLRAWGTVTFTGAQTLTLRAYWDFAGGGATQIGTSGTMSGSATTYFWQLDVDIMVYTSGATGTIAGHAHASMQTGTTARTYRTGTSPTVTKDLTGSCTLSVSAQVSSTAATVVTQGWQIIDLN